MYELWECGRCRDGSLNATNEVFLDNMQIRIDSGLMGRAYLVLVVEFPPARDEGGVEEELGWIQVGDLRRLAGTMAE